MANSYFRRKVSGESKLKPTGFLAQPTGQPSKKRGVKKRPQKDAPFIDKAEGKNLIVANNIVAHAFNLGSSEETKKNPSNSKKSNKKRSRSIKQGGRGSKPPSGRKLNRSPLEDPFANRIDEIRDLKNNAYQFYLIYAPAGYGKTYLLRELQKIMEKDPKDPYATTIWFDFKDDKDAQKDTSRLLTKLFDYLGENPYINESEPRRLNRFAQALTRSGKPAVFFFDSVEYADKNVFQWIGDKLLADLKRRERFGGIRGYFASRFERSLGGGGTEQEVSIKPYQLRYFHQEDLVLVLKAWIPARDIHNFSDAQLSSIAAAILDLTRGHPRCVTNVLRYMEESGFTTPRAGGRFAPYDRNLLFENYVQPVVIKEILEETERHINLDILRSVFMFRLLYTSIITIFLKDELESVGIEPQNINMFFISTYLQPTHLVKRGKHHGWSVDPIVRHYFAEESKLASRNQNNSNYLTAHKRVREWLFINFKENFKGRDQILCFVEMLYHWCREVEFSDPPETNKQDALLEFAELWRMYSRPDQDEHSSHANDLINQLEDEEEVDLPIMAASLIPKQVFEHFKSQIREAGKFLDSSARGSAS